MGYGVSEVSRLSGVTVRTLHHYDRIGLLRPRRRNRSGYRDYDDTDLDRLQRILSYRELGFGLDEIAGLLGSADPVRQLGHQRELVQRRIDHLQRMLTMIDKTMEAITMGIRLTPEERFEVFGEHDPAQYADEVRQRWGDTDTFRQSQERTSRYTKQDWAAMKAEGVDVERRLAEALAAGLPADGQEAMDSAEAHRQHISRWFYDCPTDMHRGLADMYLADPRFTRHYEDVAPGLAQYVHDAIHANADRSTSG